MYSPLAIAVARQHCDVVVWLLSHGADPNGYDVTLLGAHNSTSTILQLLMDAGGDVNRDSGRVPLLFIAVRGFNSEDKVRVLLAQPYLDLTTKYKGRTSEQDARYIN